MQQYTHIVDSILCGVCRCHILGRSRRNGPWSVGGGGGLEMDCGFSKKFARFFYYSDCGFLQIFSRYVNLKDRVCWHRVLTVHRLPNID